MCSRHSWICRPVALAGLALALVCPPAQAQQVQGVGGTLDMIPGQPLVRGTDSAHDPVRRVYLQVSSYGVFYGRFVDEAGAAVSAPFPISAGGSFTHYPRAIYSQDINNGSGGFLVVWNQGDGPLIGPWPSQVAHARTIVFNGSGATMGTDFTIGGSIGGNWTESAPAVGYSATSKTFLVAWQAAGQPSRVDAVRVGVTGQPIGNVFTLSDTQARDPGVVWNPNTDEFGVSYGGWDATSAIVTLARVRASDGAVLRRSVIYRSNGSFITDITFNSQAGTFVVAYAAPNVRTTEVNAAGDVVQHGVTATSVGTYDGLSIAYNAVSNTNILVGHFNKEVGGVLLDGHGVKIGVEDRVTNGGAANGSFYPRVNSNKATNQWQVSYARDFAVASSQLLTVAAAQQVVDTDGDGVPDSADVCPNFPAQTPNGCPAAPPPPTGTGDLNGDNKPDIVFENMNSGVLYSWFLSNGMMVGETVLTPGTINSTDWLLVSKTDFTGDGKLDFLWQKQSTGELLVWQMNGTTRVQEIAIPVDAGPWRVVSTPDLDRDGYPDLVWQHSGDGGLLAWFLERTDSSVALKYQGGFVNLAGNPIAPVGGGWRVVTTGDLNSDGYEDLVWQNQTSQAVVAWFLGSANGIQVVNSVSLSTNAGPWRVRMLSDMNHDGKADIVWQNGVTAERLLIWFMNGAGAMAAQNFVDPAVYLPPAWRVVGGR